MKKILLPENRKALCHQVRRIAIAAGDITLHHFDEGGYQGADAKADGSPVTQADKEAQDYINQQLRDIDDSILIVGEENKNPDVSNACLLYTSPSPRDKRQSRMPSSA